MRSTRLSILATAVLTLEALASGCTTTDSMAAKSGPDKQLSRQANACERKQNRRSECDDEPGCVWDNQAGVCTTH